MNQPARNLAMALAAALTVSGAWAQQTLPENQPLDTPQQAPAQTGEQLNGYVQQQVMAPAPTPQAASEYMGITITPGKLREYSERKYQAVTITLENKQPVHLELLQGEVLNGVDEARLAYEKQQSKAKARKIGGGLLGIAAAVPGVAYLGAGSYAAHVALSATSSAIGTTRYVVENLPDGGQGITGQYVSRVNNIVISPNQKFSFEAIVPRNATPSIKVVFKDLQSNRIFDLAQ